VRQILNADPGKRIGKRTLSFRQGGSDHFPEQREIDYGRFVFVLDSPGRAQDVVGRNPPAVAGEFVSAARSPRPSQNALPHQGLQHRFQQSGWKVMARCQCLRGNRTLARVKCDVGYGDNSEHILARQERHGNSNTDNTQRLRCGSKAQAQIYNVGKLGDQPK
jgi:hypothetical protein